MPIREQEQTIVVRDHEQTIVIDEGYTGLPEVAHGGYIAGVMAGALGAEGVEVRLRRPVPTGRRLDLERTDGGSVELRDGEALLATAAPAHVSIPVPAPVSLAEAEAASKRFLGLHGHPASECLVCGPARRDGDGLRIFPGPVAGRRLVAAPWVPAAGADPLASAALDCVQLWALTSHSPPDTPDVVVTASLRTRLAEPVVPGEPHVLIGWPIAREGRAWLAGAALLGPRGELCAVGRQTAAIASWGVPLRTPLHGRPL